jgi:hypothetical protein
MGHTRVEAARRCGVSTDWAKMFDRGLAGKMGNKSTVRGYGDLYQIKTNAVNQPDGISTDWEGYSREARLALHDIGYFALRYFGLILQPFQKYATDIVMELAASPREEYLCINQCPGSGKSTFYTLVLPAWLTARDRRIRGLICSATDKQAKWYVANLREALSTPHPISASPQDIKAGIALDAIASLSEEYGRFRPEDNATKWAQDGFYVELPRGTATAQKEPTWSAFGQSSAFLGLRVGIIVCDDVYDPSKNLSLESRTVNETWYDDVLEKRLDPGGLLIQEMQRLDPEDISHYVLEKEGTVIREGDEVGRKYHHIVFKAHYPEHCTNDHGPDAHPFDPAAPTMGGCLLYPKRISWDKIQVESRNSNFEMVYQQADVAKANALVDRLWINGGTDPDTKELYPGCLDHERELCQIPQKVDGQLLSIATMDPSPTQWWANEWWGVRVDNDRGPVERYLLDLSRAKMGANEILDWNNETQKFSGLMEEWQQRSTDLGLPITHWVVEENAAQRFMFQYEHTRRWMRKWGVSILSHQTQRNNKADPKLGVQTIGSHYRYGRVRLPYAIGGPARGRIQFLIDELIRYPNGRTDDCVMGHWFLEWNLPRLVNLTRVEENEPFVPSWMRTGPSAILRPGVTSGARSLMGASR